MARTKKAPKPEASQVPGLIGFVERAARGMEGRWAMFEPDAWPTLLPKCDEHHERETTARVQAAGVHVLARAEKATMTARGEKVTVYVRCWCTALLAKPGARELTSEVFEALPLSPGLEARDTRRKGS